MYYLSIHLSVLLFQILVVIEKKPLIYIYTDFFIVQQVTSKGTGLNPNAKVWQEIPSGNPDGTPVTEPSWHETAATSGSHPEGKLTTYWKD